MTANPIDLVGGLTSSSNVSKSDITAWAKARVPQTMASASEVNSTNLAGQAVITLKTGGFFQQDTTDTTTADDGVNCLVSLDGKRFKVVTFARLGAANIFADTTEATGAGTTASGIFSGGLEVLKKLFVTGVAAFEATTASTSNTTGAVTVAGGLGVTGSVSVGGANQFGAYIAIRNPVKTAIEWGHNNLAGYGSSIGCDLGSGRPWILFHGSQGASNNTYKTWGIKGSYFGSDLAGGFIFGTVPNASADNQTFTKTGGLDADGNLAVTGSIGYGVGAGGIITQSTSKATGVILNKASGQITLNNAALASAAIVSFTLTNSVIAATDTVSINLKGGNATAATYRIHAEAISPGSCIIVVTNISGGSLSEALVLNFNIIKGVNS